MVEPQYALVCAQYVCIYTQYATFREWKPCLIGKAAWPLFEGPKGVAHDQQMQPLTTTSGVLFMPRSAEASSVPSLWNLSN